MKLRIYVDTSVLGGCEDLEFQESSRQLMRHFVEGDWVLVLSKLTLMELGGAPAQVRARLKEVPEEHIEVLQVDVEARDLANAYVSESVISEGFRANAQHIAMATLARVDVLVSWNFKHIVNLHRIHGYNSVNLRRGYHLLEIRTPWEVLPEDE